MFTASVNVKESVPKVSVHSVSTTFPSQCNTSEDVWYQYHPSERVMPSIFKRINVTALGNEKSSFCDACHYGKSHNLPFKNLVSFTTKPLCLYKVIFGGHRL